MLHDSLLRLFYIIYRVIDKESKKSLREPLKKKPQDKVKKVQATLHAAAFLCEQPHFNLNSQQSMSFYS